MFQLIKKSIRALNVVRVSTLAAALSFFSILSLAPLITITIFVAGLFFSEDTVKNQIVTGTSQLIGAPAAAIVRNIVNNSSRVTAGGILPLISFGVLLYAASRIFWQLRISLDFLWGVKAGERASIRARLLTVAWVLGVGVFLVGAMLLNALAAALVSGFAETLFSDSRAIVWLLSMLVAPTAYCVIFAAIFRFFPSIRLNWSSIWPGAALTAVLFWIGNHTIWFFLAFNTTASLYGAAGIVVILLLWTYASAAILLFGAEYTRVIAEHRGKAFMQSARPEPSAAIRHSK